MRLQIIDPTLRFACSSCGRCCDHPWRVSVEPEKLAAIDATDWGQLEPALRGRRLYKKVRLGRQKVAVLEKGEGNKCIFLDENRLCRIHKHLGFDAKPEMCKWFPFLPSAQRDADYVSASYGCPSIQNLHGPLATTQAAAIATTIRVSSKPAQPEAAIPITGDIALPRAAGRDLIDRMGAIMAGGEQGPRLTGDSLADRLSAALDLLEEVLPTPVPEPAAGTDDCAAAGGPDAAQDGDGPPHRQAAPFDSARQAPLPCRFLFAATMASDALPPGAIDGLKFFHRWTLIPRLMSLAQMQGTYPSMMFQRNVRVDEIMCRPATWFMPPEALTLLGRYSRSRLWQQFPGRVQLPLLAGFHQHIMDLNALVFLAAVRATLAGQTALDSADVQAALHWVEFQIANQSRVHDQVLRGWVSAALGNVHLARQSIWMLRCAAGSSGTRPPAVESPSPTATTATGW